MGLHRVGQDCSALARPHAQLPHFPSLFTLSSQQTKPTFPSLTLTVLHHHSSIYFSSLFSPMYLGHPCSSPSCYFFFFFLASCGVLDPQPGIEPKPPALEAQNLSHWTTREVPSIALFLLLTLPSWEALATHPHWSKASIL